LETRSILLHVGQTVVIEMISARDSGFQLKTGHGERETYRVAWWAKYVCCSESEEGRQRNVEIAKSRNRHRDAGFGVRCRYALIQLARGEELGEGAPDLQCTL
jgi:hypothetical protein